MNSTITTLIGVAMGGAISGLTAVFLSRREDGRLKTRLESERQQAREGRTQARIEGVYELALRYVLAAARIFAAAANETPSNEALTIEMVSELNSKMFAYGSKEVRDLLGDWSDLAQDAMRCTSSLKMLLNRPGSSRTSDWNKQYDDAKKELVNLAPSIKAVADKLAERINQELRQEDQST